MSPESLLVGGGGGGLGTRLVFSKFVLLYFCCMMQRLFAGSFTYCHVHDLPHTNLSILRLYSRVVACHVELYCVLSIVHSLLYCLYSERK